MTHSQVRVWLVLAVVAGALALCGPAPAQEARGEGKAQAAQTPPKAEHASAPKAGAKAPEEFPEPPRATRPGDAQRVFVIQHVSANQLAKVLKVFPAEIRSVDSRGLNALAVSAKPPVLAAIGETIKRLDQPNAGVESASSSVGLTGYILEGLDERQEPEALPAELQAVVGQLRRTFKYGGYRLLDTIVARTRADGSHFSVAGVTEKKLNGLGPSYYHLDANRTAVVGDAPRVVQLTNLNFGLEIPVPVGPPPSDNSKPREFQYKRIGLSSDMDIRDGQYVVVGKSGLGDSENALVLVLTAKVVD
jgi:hypothetical protein